MQARLRTRARSVYTLGMLEHLLDPEFEDLAKATSSAVLAAQAGTVGWLESLGSPEYLLDEDSQTAADVRKAFAASTTVDVSDDKKKQAILALRTPAAVRHLAGMLSQYDWDFIEQAKEIRGYVVAKLLEETKSGDPRIRLRALELTGKLTEVGSFTTRVEITSRTESSVEELTDRIKEKIARLANVSRAQLIEDVTEKQPQESP